MVRRVSKDVAVTILGATVGVSLSPLVEHLAPGIVPLPIPSPWNKNEIFYPLIGSVGSVIGGFLIDKDYVSEFLIGLGVSGIVSTVIKATLTPVTARFQPRPLQRPARLVARVPAVARTPAISPARPVPQQFQTPTSIPPTVILG